MIPKIATPMIPRILLVILVAVSVSVISLSKAEDCTLSQWTKSNGSHEVLIPDPQSSIPSDLLRTPSSVTDDGGPLDVVGEDDQDDDDRCRRSNLARIFGIHYVTDQSPPHVDVQTDASPCPAVTSGITTEIRTEGREEEEDDDDKDSFKLGNTLVGLTFDAAVFLMFSRIQPRGNSSMLATWSPSWLMSAPPPPPPFSLSSPAASFPITMAPVAIVFSLTVSLIGWILMLRRGHTTAANVCKYAFILSVAVTFYPMTYVFVPDSFAWAVWAAGSILLLVFAYFIAQRMMRYVTRLEEVLVQAWE